MHNDVLNAIVHDIIINVTEMHAMQSLKVSIGDIDIYNGTVS
jgi:hypothetical protein